MESGQASVMISSMKNQAIEFSFPLGYKELRIDGKVYGECGSKFELELKKDAAVKLDFRMI